MNRLGLKGLSILCSVGGLILSLVNTIIDDKKQDLDIREAVAEEVKKQLEMKK